jgi:DNA ligase-1
MLAKSYDKEAHKVEFPCYAQPKLDGMRALGYSDKFISRKGKEILNMDHILEELAKMKLAVPLDGELYAHGKSFQENMRLIKKYRPGETEEIKYHIYDYADPDMSFEHRLKVLTLLATHSIVPFKHIEIVPTITINDEADLKKLHAKSLRMGYEGTIVRWGDAGYKSNSRSSNLLKYKDFQDLACTIVDVEPSVKRPEQGQFICEYKDVSFGCGMKFSHDERENILTNASDYIGQTAEIRFFEYSEDGIPRFPVCVGVRLDK